MFTRISLLLVLISSLFLWVPTSQAAPAPLLPPDDTGDLYVLENDCECVLAIDKSGNVSVLVSRDDLITLFGLDPQLASLSSGEHGIATSESGAIYFGAGYEDPVTDDRLDSIVERSSDGTLSILTSSADILALTGGNETELNGLAFGIDGRLYTAESKSDSVLSIDPVTGTCSTLVDEASLKALIPESSIDLEPGIATDENYVYISSDGTPEILYRVSYGGVPEIFTAGPGTDPFNRFPFILALGVSDETTGGDFIFEILDGMGATPVGPIAWNASAAAVKAAFDSAAPGTTTTITGSGSELDPWLVEFIPASLGWNLFDTNLVGVGASTFSENVQESNVVPVQSEIMGIGTDAAPGPPGPDTQIDVSISLVGRYLVPDIEATWFVGDTAATVQSALEADPGVDPGDVGVTGSGSLADPWVLSFQGNLANTSLSFNECCDSTNSLAGSPVFYERLQSAKAFYDLDVFLTRRDDGELMMADDQAQFFYRIDLAGNPTLFKNAWQLLSDTGFPVDLEGGLAYDDAGDLFAAVNSNDLDTGLPTIVRIEPDGTLQNWVSAETIAMATGGQPVDVDFDSGIAFERSPAAGDRIRLAIRTSAIDYALDDVTITGGDLRVDARRRRIKEVSGDADVPSPVMGTANVEIDVRKRRGRRYEGRISVDDPGAGVQTTGYFWGRVTKTDETQARGTGFYLDTTTWPWQFGSVEFEVTDVPAAP
ncbi:hypothetical protein MK489_05880 [Myxococcota bacterium]|nr:hypothetical protein [Myxococcota bacterium]